MSYCRFLEGDVYAYDSCEGGVQFYVHSDTEDGLDRLCRTYTEAYEYAKELRDEHGVKVPDFAIEAMREDAIEEAERFAGLLDRAIEDLKAENAKLKEQVQEAEYEESRAWDIVHGTELRNDKWKALCRDMMLVVELMDLDHMKLQAHGKDADWRTLQERYYELGEDFKSIGCWTVEDDQEEFSDNIEASIIVWRKKCKSK